MRGRGPLITPSPAALVTDLVAQLLIDDGVTSECFKTTFPITGVKK